MMKKNEPRTGRMSMVPKKPTATADEPRPTKLDAAAPQDVPSGLHRPPLVASGAPLGTGEAAPPPAVPTTQRNILHAPNANFAKQLAARTAGFDTQMLPLAEIQLDVAQPRQRSKYSEQDRAAREAEISELARSIAREGLRHPIEVEELQTEPGLPSAYRLVVGETRLLAYRHLAAQDSAYLTIPALVKRNLTLAERRLHQFSENYYRQQLTPVEESDALQLMRHDLATLLKLDLPLAWDDLPKHLPGLTPVAVDHARRIAQLPESAKDLLRARHQPARSTIVRALRNLSLDDDVAVLAALNEAIRKSDDEKADQTATSRTEAARQARRQGIALRRFATIKVDTGGGAPMALDVRVGLDAGQWKTIQRDPAARHQHELVTWQRVKETAELQITSLEGGAGETDVAT